MSQGTVRARRTLSSPGAQVPGPGGPSTEAGPGSPATRHTPAADAADAVDDVTPRRWASITACPDGPLLVRGDVEILGPGGSPVPRRRGTVALCRCGASGIKPYCDGSHKVIGFRTDDVQR